MEQKAYRHGEIALVKIDKLPEEIRPSDSEILMKGSHGHDHSFKGGIFYPFQKGEFVFGYLVANGTVLFHPEHGEGGENKLKEAKLPDGIYELRKQHEHTPDGLKQIID
jgi:hypothetical protein